MFGVKEDNLGLSHARNGVTEEEKIDASQLDKQNAPIIRASSQT